MVSIAPKVYGTNLQAFVEKAFRSSQGKGLSNADRYIGLVVAYLEQFLDGNTNKLLVNLPGRHLKTFICSVCLQAFMLGSNPTLKFLIVAYNEELAEDIVRQIREIMQSPWYKKVFDTRLDPSHSTKTDFAVTGGGRVRAAAVGSVTGKGGDIVVFDDPHNIADWDNDRRKARVIEAFETLVSRRDGGTKSRLLVVCHRIAEDDLSAHIIERDDFAHLCLPLVAYKAMSFEVGDTTFELAKGQALRSEAFPPAEVESLRRHHQGSPFRLYYLQGLGPKKDDLQIDESHLRFVSWNLQDHVADAHVVLSVDPAQKTESASRNVIHAYAVTGNRYILLQAFAEKCTFQRLLIKVKKMAQFHGATMILVENTARGPDLIERIRCELAVKIRAINPQGTKAARLRSCLPVIRAKRLQLKRNRPEVEAAAEEILAYPYGAYNDHVDAMTNFLLVAATFDAWTFVNTRRLQPASAALVTASQPKIPISTPGMAIARGQSLSRQAPLPDFSTGNSQPDRRADGRSHYAAEESSEPVFNFDGEKMVRIK